MNREIGHREERNGEIPENPKTFTSSYTVRILMARINISFIYLRDQAADLKSAGRKAVGVRVPLRAPTIPCEVLITDSVPTQSLVGCE